jgi:nicotinamidase-related amidase
MSCIKGRNLCTNYRFLLSFHLNHLSLKGITFVPFFLEYNNNNKPINMSNVPHATPTAGKTLLTPKDHTLIMIDHQSQMAFATRSIDIQELRNNCALVAKAAKAFGASTILTTVAEQSFSGPIFSEIRSVFPDADLIDRTTMNSWEDKNFIDAVNQHQKSRLVFSGLWTSVCISGPVLSAIDQGFEAYVITDACGDVSKEAHEMAMHRMIAAGARPITSIMYLLELQRDWARAETYDITTKIAREHAGGYGLGIGYAKTMFGAQEGKVEPERESTMATSAARSSV